MRIDSLDGLRGIAILSVLLVHHGLFHNGWMGVDLFFVLSGFLITGILRRNREEPFYWRPFYIKRAARILPPLVLTIVLAFVFTKNASVFVALGYLLSLGGFLELSSHHITALGPLWSLAVEEHFYLVWPFAVRFLSRRALYPSLAILILGVACLRFVYSHPVPMAQLTPIYFLTPFRIDEMGFGCLLAITIESSSMREWLARWSQLLFAGFAALYLWLWVHLGHIHFFPAAHTKLFDTVGYSLVATICFFAIAHVTLRPKAWMSRVLALKPLAFLGRISYGIYLYHLLVKDLVMWAGGISIERNAFLFDFPLVVLVSWVSFRYFETPLMNWGRARASTYNSNPERTKATQGTSDFDRVTAETMTTSLESLPT